MAPSQICCSQVAGPVAQLPVVRPPLIPMFRQIINTLRGWLKAARSNAEGAKRAPTLPAWLALGILLFDFALIGFGFRYTGGMSVLGGAFSALILYLVRLCVVTATLVLACRHNSVSGEALGIRPSSLLSDFRWASRICLLSALIIVAVLFLGFLTARGLGIHLPAPPQLIVQVLGGDYPIVQFVGIAGLAGVVLILLAPLTEELVYRSVFLPVLACRIGLFPAVAVTAVVFG